MSNDANNLGIGVLVNWLSGNEETFEALKNGPWPRKDIDEAIQKLGFI